VRLKYFVFGRTKQDIMLLTTDRKWYVHLLQTWNT